MTAGRLCLLLLCSISIAALAESVDLTVNDFLPEDQCLVKTSLEAYSGLNITRDFIYGPGKDQDYGEWLKMLSVYRDIVLSGEAWNIFEFNFDGVRVWTRLDIELSKVCDFQPLQRFKISMDARYLSGSNFVYVAFDVHKRWNDIKTGWFRMQDSGMEIPDDGKWHQVSRTFTVPKFDHATTWIRPIIGMDGFFDKTVSKVQIRNIQIDCMNLTLNQKIAEMVKQRKSSGLDTSIYDRDELKWQSENFACHLTFMYDSSFYDPKAGYKLDSFVDDGQQQFGGYDSILLWQAYPRIGVDERNQFDFYRDMPGGLSGIRKLVDQLHASGVKVFIDYNPWDTGTRREDKSDDQMLVELLKEIDADGIFLDTMTEAKMSLRQLCDKSKNGISLVPECNIAVNQLPYCSGSWAQYFQDKTPPGMLRLKWIEPRHMQYQIKRWNTQHSSEVESAFFNGSGIKIWENVFGTYMPWNAGDSKDWKKAVGILRCFADIFTSRNWEPFYPTQNDKIFAHKWYGDGVTIFTVLNYSDKKLENQPLFEISAEDDVLYYDLWTGEPIEVLKLGGAKVEVIRPIDTIGCVLAIQKSKMNDKIKNLLARQAELHSTTLAETGNRQIRSDIRFAKPVVGSNAVSLDSKPEGMVYVPGDSYVMKLEHRRRECGCYPDPESPEEEWFKNYIMGHPWDGQVSHNIGPVEVKPFFIDETLVTNEQFKRFLYDSGYEPECKTNFLKHWRHGRMPAGLADHPVVYVDIDDARAYAKWAGKRLPTEVEWQLAAQGNDGRKWPWGNEFDANKCNTTGDRTEFVKAHPNGRSPYGCYDMSGNVWQWTESYRDDGHTRFVMIRGGSYFDAKGSDWYVKGGPMACNSHTKFILMYPGLDRCATIGFRCVVDVKTE